jgi:hypothetical protein
LERCDAGNRTAFQACQCEIPEVMLVVVRLAALLKFDNKEGRLRYLSVAYMHRVV